MSGIEVAVGSHFLDTLASIVFSGIVRHRPKNQLKTGDDYLDRALILTEQHRAILHNDDRKDIEDEFIAAGRLKNELELQGGLRALVVSHKYKRQAKQAFSLAKDRSTLARMAQAFSMDVADAVVDIAAHENGISALNEETKDELRLRVVNSIDTSPEGHLYSHENTSTADIAEVARKVWAMMKVENMVFFRAT